MSKKIKVSKEEIDEMYDPQKFYNYGDNPAMQKFMEITQQNQMEGKQIDHRTYVVDQRKKYYIYIYIYYIFKGSFGLVIGKTSCNEI